MNNKEISPYNSSLNFNVSAIFSTQIAYQNHIKKMKNSLGEDDNIYIINFTKKGQIEKLKAAELFILNSINNYNSTDEHDVTVDAVDAFAKLLSDGLIPLHNAVLTTIAEAEVPFSTLSEFVFIISTHHCNNDATKRFLSNFILLLKMHESEDMSSHCASNLLILIYLMYSQPKSKPQKRIILMEGVSALGEHKNRILLCLSRYARMNYVSLQYIYISDMDEGIASLFVLNDTYSEGFYMREQLSELAKTDYINKAGCELLNLIIEHIKLSYNKYIELMLLINPLSKLRAKEVFNLETECFITTMYDCYRSYIDSYNKAHDLDGNEFNLGTLSPIYESAVYEVHQKEIDRVISLLKRAHSKGIALMEKPV